MSNPLFSYYRHGLAELINKMGRDHPRFTDALVYQHRLLENLEQTAQYGDTPEREAQRAEILGLCNQLSLNVLEQTFHELCGLRSQSSDSIESVDALSSQAARCQIEGDLTSALHLYEKIKDINPDYPRIDSQIRAVKRELNEWYIDRYGRVDSRLSEYAPLPADLQMPAKRLNYLPLLLVLILLLGIVAVILWLHWPWWILLIIVGVIFIVGLVLSLLL